MKATKQITELVEKPRIDGVKVLKHITSDEIELTGYKQNDQQLTAGKYRYIDFSDILLEKLSANNLQTFRSTCIRCIFDNAQMTGLSLPQGNFKDVIFRNCRLNFTNFRSATFERCLFIDSNLCEADFAMSQFKNIEFSNCELKNTEFSNAKCQRVEFTNCSLNVIKGISGLKGASISELNLIELAPLFCSEFGIKVKE